MIGLLIKGTLAILLSIILTICVITLTVLTITYLGQFIAGIIKSENLTNKCINFRELYFNGFKNLLKRKSK